MKEEKQDIETRIKNIASDLLAYADESKEGVSYEEGVAQLMEIIREAEIAQLSRRIGCPEEIFKDMVKEKDKEIERLKNG